VAQARHCPSERRLQATAARQTVGLPRKRGVPILSQSSSRTVSSGDPGFGTTS